MKKFLIYLLFICASVFIFSSSSFAAIYISAEGSYGNFNQYLEKTRNVSAKASVAADINSNFRISYSYRHSVEKTQGHQKYAYNNTLFFYETKSETLTRIHSIDLIGVLYNGKYFVPYVFGGVAYKLYDLKYENAAINGKYTENKTLGPVENFGCGLSIALSSNFSLKISNTWSPGIKLTPEEYTTSEGTKVFDSVTDVGISIAIR